jgi:hypothetical protein
MIKAERVSCLEKWLFSVKAEIVMPAANWLSSRRRNLKE